MFKMTDEERWQAVSKNDRACDGKFFYAVKTTGIFCRPSCSSKRPKQKNIEWFETAEAAVKAGYRPCKRCRPDQLFYNPVKKLAEKTRQLIDEYFREKTALNALLKELGVSQHRLTEVFKELYGLTPKQYIDDLKINYAKEKLKLKDEEILEIAYATGFQSLSAFYEFFTKRTSLSPAQYRKQLLEGEEKMSAIQSIVYTTAYGTIEIGYDEEAVVFVRLNTEKTASDSQEDNNFAKEIKAQFDAYFFRQRQNFDLPLKITGTDFQKKVWNELRKIPYGETRTYKEIATAIGNPNASRAVGMANNKNKIAIIIPCHRVIGANGKLVGYAGGLEMKKGLLQLENAGEL